MNGQFEVLSPWAEADPLPLRGISPRPADLNGKTIGLFVHYGKGETGFAIQRVVERKLKERFPTVKFSNFIHNGLVEDAEDKKKFEKWVKGVNAVVLAVGD